MKDEFLKHYKHIEYEAQAKLKEFEHISKASEKKLFEEMAFCVFAANSSAEMGLLATKLLRPILDCGTLDDYKQAVYKKVRFYNKRTEYLFYNKLKLKEMNLTLKEIINIPNKYEKRSIIKNNFKGFGLKEASHFLRNTGTKGLCIIDKHVMTVIKDLKVIDKDTQIKRDEDYYAIEQKIITFAKDHKLNLDILDLAAWSYMTGKIIK
ncbi:MAG: hypothetical protein ACLFN8_02380 [Candidatus Woesearchaeota archaeon]